MLSSIGYVVSLLSLRSLEEHVTLKRKALDDFIDSSQHPARKRHACTSYLPQAPVAFVTACDIPKPAKARRGTLSRSYAIADLNEIPLDVWAPGCQSGPAISQARDLCDGAKSKLMKGAEAKTSEVGRQSAEQDSKNMSKRKALEEVPSGSSPQTPKRRSLSHSPVIANLIIPTLSTTYSAVQSPHWPFLNELVLNILEKLSALDLRSIAQVSCLSRDLAAPLYFRSVGLQFDDKSLLISTQACLALPLYRRTTFFQTPKYLRCNLLDADDRHLKALLGFLESFEGTQVFFVSIVKDGEMLGDFAPLFQFSDREAFYHAYPPPVLPEFVAIPTPPNRCNFQTFHANSPIFFSRSMVSLTLSSLRNSSLTDLSLTRTSLSAIQWTALMHNLHLPQLIFLSVDIECPTAALVEFLPRHDIHQLWLYGQCVDAPHHLMQKTDTPRIPLHNLRVLAGPLWYLASLLQKVRVPLRIQTLELYLDEESLASAPNYLSAILDITQQFIAIDCLGLSFYHQSLISGSFDLPLDEYRTIPVRKVTIYLPHWYRYSDQHPLASATHKTTLGVKLMIYAHRSAAVLG
ncbi:hypothetical protein BD769DRAFT_1678157 [Suillus cothurnatus]|nr:hypothetical protein BD769DRAFT_1678157 [Suillus cothurnatus]